MANWVSLKTNQSRIPMLEYMQAHLQAVQGRFLDARCQLKIVRKYKNSVRILNSNQNKAKTLRSVSIQLILKEPLLIIKASDQAHSSLPQLTLTLNQLNSNGRSCRWLSYSRMKSQTSSKKMYKKTFSFRQEQRPLYLLPAQRLLLKEKFPRLSQPAITSLNIRKVFRVKK